MNNRFCVVVESPYRGATYEETARNRRYAEHCLRDSLDRGESPMMSHLLYTIVLDDTNPSERIQGMSAGWHWMNVCDYVVVYTDLGFSKGMIEGMNQAQLAGKKIVFRELGKDSVA